MLFIDIQKRAQSEGSIKNYKENSFIDVDVEYPKKIHELHNDLSFSLETIKTEKLKNLIVICMIKKICCTYEYFKISTRSWIIIA